MNYIVIEEKVPFFCTLKLFNGVRVCVKINDLDHDDDDDEIMRAKIFGSSQSVRQFSDWAGSEPKYLFWTRIDSGSM